MRLILVGAEVIVEDSTLDFRAEYRVSIPSIAIGTGSFMHRIGAQSGELTSTSMQILVMSSL